VSALQALVTSLPPATPPCVSIEWIVDICDTEAGWFIGTALSYTETAEKGHKSKGQLHVVVPDSENPTWTGTVECNFQMLRLVECCDESSQALFNELVRESVVPVDWQVEWCDPRMEEEEEDDDEAYFTEGDAIYLVRLMNAIICRPTQEEEEPKEDQALVLTPCDHNLRLLRCLAGSQHTARSSFHDCTGVTDFERLVTEGVVDWSGEGPAEEVYRAAEKKLKEKKSPEASSSSSSSKPSRSPPPPPSSSSSSLPPRQIETRSLSERRESHLQKLTQLYLKMRDCMGDALSERERCVAQRKSMIDNLVKYVFGGDIAKGLALIDELKKDDGEGDPTREKMALVTKISKILSELSNESREIFTNKEARKSEMKTEIERLRTSLGEAKKKESDLYNRRS